MGSYLIGSQLLGLQNCKDTDILVISTEYDHKREKKDGKDIVYRSKANLLKYMKFEVDLTNNIPLLLYNYQLDKTIIGQKFPIEYNILDYKDKLIELIEFVIENKAYNFNPRITIEGCCTKNIYQIAYNIFILQNKSPLITSEQKEIIQKIHDGTMSTDYIEELKKIFKELKKEVKQDE